jgi:hypothetical protein
MSDSRKYLGIYLNDHLAGSAGGHSLAKRISKGHSDPDARREGERLAKEIEGERKALTAIIKRLGGRPKMARQAGAAGMEKVGRLKLNGSIIKRSPLSDLVELEGMSLGVNGKLRMWQALRSIAPSNDALDEAELDRLIKQAEDQIARLDALRLKAGRAALG